jgi:hypothetical protein
MGYRAMSCAAWMPHSSAEIVMSWNLYNGGADQARVRQLFQVKGKRCRWNFECLADHSGGNPLRAGLDQKPEDGKARFLS